MLPLGTGNDFSRVTGWGKVYSSQCSTPTKARHLVDALSSCSFQKFDRWKVHLTREAAIPESAEVTTQRDMLNYFSVGTYSLTHERSLVPFIFFCTFHFLSLSICLSFSLSLYL